MEIKEEVIDHDYFINDHLKTEVDEDCNDSSFPFDLEFKAVKGKYELLPLSLCPHHGWSSLQGKACAKIRANNSACKRQAIDVLNAAYNDPFKDVKIICKDDNVVKCHKVILSKVSGYLDCVLSKDVIDETIFLPDFSVQAVTFLLKICYFVDVESSVDEEFASELQDLVLALDIDLSMNEVEISKDKGLKRKRTFALFQHSNCQKCERNRKRKLVTSEVQQSKYRKKEVANDTVMLIKCISCNNSIGISVKDHNRVQAHVQKSNPGKSMRYQCQPCVNAKKEPYSASKPRPSGDAEQSLLCWSCGAMYDSQAKLKKHIDDHFKTHKCVDCGKEFQEKDDLVKHTSAVHMSGIPKCPLCPERVTIGMEMHMKYHHSGMEGHKKCDLCAFEAFNGSSLKSHKKRYHGISPSQKSLGATKILRPPRVEDRSEDFKVQCDQCPMQMRPESLNQHLENHHNPDLPFECQYCQYRSATELSINLHETKIHFKTKFVDNNEMLESKKKLEDFLEYELESGTKVKCDLCPQVCDPNLLTKHVEEHHNPNLPFGCRFCGFRTLFENGVKLHENKFHYELKHGKKKPMILCSNGCGKDFWTLFNMKRHLKRRCRLSNVKEDLIQKEKDSEDYNRRHLKRNEMKKERRDKLRKFQLENAI